MRRRTHGPTPDRPRKVMSRASYSAVKQGHIIPATYQRNFAFDEMVAVHVPGRTACVTLHVENAGTRSRFYRRARRDGSQIDDIEASPASLEAVAGPVLRDVVTGAPLTVSRMSAVPWLAKAGEREELGALSCTQCFVSGPHTAWNAS